MQSYRKNSPTAVNRCDCAAFFEWFHSCGCTIVQNRLIQMARDDVA